MDSFNVWPVDRCAFYACDNRGTSEYHESIKKKIATDLKIDMT